MKSFIIKDKKSFMNKLLAGDVFDNFLLVEAEINTFSGFHIDGRIKKEFFESDGLPADFQNAEFVPFSHVKRTCFEIIKGTHTPLSFKFVLMLSPENAAKTIAASGSRLTDADISGIYLNILFSNGELMVTSGISYATFTPDKSFENAWDGMVERFLG